MLYSGRLRFRLTRPTNDICKESPGLRGIFEATPRCTGSYRFIDVEPQHVEIDEDAIWNTVSINGITRLAKEGRLNVNVVSD